MNATIYSTRSPKPAYYVEGTPYQRGYLTGILAEAAAGEMVTTYINHAPWHMIDKNLDWKEWRSNRTVGPAIYDAVVDVLGSIIVEGSQKAFWRDRARGYIPESLFLEMRGLYDGARKANPHTRVTLERVIALNYGIDFVSSRIFSGDIVGDVHATAKRLRMPSAVQAALRAVDLARLLQPPAACDAFCVSGEATRSGNDAFFARDFMFGDGRCMMRLLALTVVVPFEAEAPHAVVLTHAPGMIGGITAVNAAGVAMGVDTLVSAAVNPSAPGLNSIMLVRHTMQSAASADEALAVIGAARRGVPWLHPLCDQTGNGYVIESGMYTEGDAPEDPLRFTHNETLLQTLPSGPELVRASLAGGAKHIHGMWARPAGFAVPAHVLALNDRLFRMQGMAPLPPAAWGPRNTTWASPAAEEAADKGLHDNYFAPARALAGTPGGAERGFVVSNHAVIPAARAMQTGDLVDALAGFAHTMHSQWRFDTLSENIRARAAGDKFDLDATRHEITFLAPDRQPGYWPKEWTPGKPMTALVEGAITVADLRRGTVMLKSGFWCDEWTTISLPNYVAEHSLLQSAL